MGVPTSEVGYTIATTRRETTKVHKNMWWQWGGISREECGLYLTKPEDLQFLLVYSKQLARDDDLRENT